MPRRSWRRSAPDGRLIGLDRDPAALATAGAALQRFGDRVTLVHARFSQARVVLERLGMMPVDGFLVDLGVSSPQLDRAERGFSFRTDGPLDMRMDPTTGETAAELLRRVDEDELTRIIRDYGEERHAARVARAIIEARSAGPVETTGKLAAHRRARAAAPRAQQEPGDADVPGPAHRGQRRAGRAGALPGGRDGLPAARAGGWW